MAPWKRRLQQAAADLLALPPDSMMDVPRVTCIGGQELVVEHVVSLLRVSPEQISANLGEQVLNVYGQSFDVPLVSDGEVHVRGVIERIEFVRRGGRAK